MSFIRKSMFALAMIAISGCASAMEPSPPPPPKRSLEIFNPTLRSHATEAQCAGASMEIAWAFDGKAAKFSRLTFNGAPASLAVLNEVNDVASVFGGDVLVTVECNNSGAIIRVIEYLGAGSCTAKQALLNYVDGHMSIVRKYNF